MAEGSDSTVPRRRLGRLLREAREAAGIKLDDAADALEYGRHKIWRIEKGVTAVRTLDVEAMCRLYRVDTRMTEVMKGLAAATKDRGWWHAYGDAVPAWFDLFLGLESEANVLRRFDDELVPGLLQTERYARAIFLLDRPDQPEEERERAIEVRLKRQNLLTRRVPAPPTLDVILSEAVLRRRISDHAAMADQLGHLLDVAALPNVSLRVLPLAAGPHRGAVAGSFVVLDFPPPVNGRGPVEPTTVYAESITGALYLDKPEEVATFGHVWTSLDELALGRGESRKMITEIIGETHND